MSERRSSRRDELVVDLAEAAGLEQLESLGAQEAALYAARAGQVHDSAVLSRRLEGAGGPERFLVIDLAGTLRIGQLAATRLLDEASRLVEVLTQTLVGLRTGHVFVAQARVVLEETGLCSEQVAAEVDRRLHAGAPEGFDGWTARRLHDRVRRLVLQVEADLEPDETHEREQRARAGRRVSVRPEPDGMASLWALLPAEQLRAFTVGLDELHRRQVVADRAAGVERTADQRRADVLAMLPALALHALDGTAPGPLGHVCSTPVTAIVHVPLATALGLSDAPGLLDGYGPISAMQTRQLLPHATLRRLVVDDSTGRPLHTRTLPVVRPDGPRPQSRARRPRPERTQAKHPAGTRPTTHGCAPGSSGCWPSTRCSPTTCPTRPSRSTTRAQTWRASSCCAMRFARHRAAPRAAGVATSTTRRPTPRDRPRRATSRPAAGAATGPRPSAGPSSAPGTADTAGRARPAAPTASRRPGSRRPHGAGHAPPTCRPWPRCPRPFGASTR